MLTPLLEGGGNYTFYALVLDCRLEWKTVSSVVVEKTLVVMGPICYQASFL